MTPLAAPASWARHQYNMTYESDARFLMAVILGHVDPLAPGNHGRLLTMQAQYRSAGDGGMLDLIGRAKDVRAVTEQAADREYLNGMLDGTVDLLSESVFPCLAPMFYRHPEGSEMYALLERAAAAFADAVQEISTWVLAGVAIDEARRGACGMEDSEE